MKDLYVKQDAHDKDIYHLYLKHSDLSFTIHWHVAAMFIDVFCDAFDITDEELEKITTELSPAPFDICRKKH